jgi:hypothetical protein
MLLEKGGEEVPQTAKTKIDLQPQPSVLKQLVLEISIQGIFCC